jgi:hypothetical protein
MTLADEIRHHQCHSPSPCHEIDDFISHQLKRAAQVFGHDAQGPWQVTAHWPHQPSRQRTRAQLSHAILAAIQLQRDTTPPTKITITHRPPYVGRRATKAPR